MEVIDGIDVLSSKGEILDPCSSEGIFLVLRGGGGMEVTDLYSLPVFWVVLACGEGREKVLSWHFLWTPSLHLTRF